MCDRQNFLHFIIIFYSNVLLLPFHMHDKSSPFPSQLFSHATAKVLNILFEIPFGIFCRLLLLLLLLCFSSFFRSMSFCFGLCRSCMRFVFHLRFCFLCARLFSTLPHSASTHTHFTNWRSEYFSLAILSFFASPFFAFLFSSFANFFIRLHRAMAHIYTRLSRTHITIREMCVHKLIWHLEWFFVCFVRFAVNGSQLFRTHNLFNCFQLVFLLRCCCCCFLVHVKLFGTIHKESATATNDNTTKIILICASLHIEFSHIMYS